MLIRAINAITLLLMVTFLCGCQGELALYQGLAEPAANAIVAELKDKGIDAAKQSDKTGYSVSIAMSDLPEAVKILHSAGLPSQSYVSLGDVFRKEGMISSPLEERVRYIYALSQELEFTLSQIDGVIMARVHIVLPERISAGEPIQPASAAVFIKYNRDIHVEKLQPVIRRMARSSIPGMVDADDKKLSISFIPTTEYKTQSIVAENKKPNTMILYLLGCLCLLASFYFFIQKK